MTAIEIILQSFEPAPELSKNTKLYTTRELIKMISGIIDVSEDEMADDLKSAGFKVHLHTDDGEPVGFRWMINKK
jgi:ribosomal protein L11 methylase PrmA